MAKEKSEYAKRCDAVDDLAVKMVTAPTEDERESYKIKLFEKIYEGLVRIDGDKVYLGFSRAKEAYSMDDFQAIMLDILSPSEKTGGYKYQPEKGGFVSYLNWLCSKRKGEGFRPEYERVREYEQNEEIAFNGNPEDDIEEEMEPGIVEYLFAILQRLDMEDGEKREEKGVYKGKIWIKLTFESMKYIKETIDKEIDEEMEQINKWNKNKIDFSEEDVEFRRKDILEELQQTNLVAYLYPFALSYYYEMRPSNVQEMYGNELFGTIWVMGLPLELQIEPFPLRGRHLVHEHLLYCVNQFLVDRGEKPMKLDNMKKWMTTNYGRFMGKIGQEVKTIDLY